MFIKVKTGCEFSLTASGNAISTEVVIAAGDRILHLTEFGRMPYNQPEWLSEQLTELDGAIAIHLDSFQQAFNAVWTERQCSIMGSGRAKQRFNPDLPYWEDLARIECHLYHVVHVKAAK